MYLAISQIVTDEFVLGGNGRRLRPNLNWPAAGPYINYMSYIVNACLSCWPWHVSA